MKKVLVILLSSLTIASFSIFLASCGHKHAYVTTQTQAMCAQEGYATYTCECGDTYIDEQSRQPALGHEFINYQPDGNATYESDGTKTAVCNRCGDATDTVTDVGSMLSHFSFDENDDGSFTVTGYDNTDTEIVIPTTYQGQPVVAISSLAFSQNKNITKVTVPEGIVSVGGFSECSNLTQVILPSTLKTINDRAFTSCKKLKAVNLPEGLETIGGNAFYGCQLTTITIPSTVTEIKPGAFLYCEGLIEVVNKSALVITVGNSNNGDVGYYAKQVITDESLSKIAKVNGFIFYVDQANSYLVGYEGSETILSLPEKVDGYNYQINALAFANDDTITSITIPTTVKTFGNDAFLNATALKKVNYLGTANEWATLSFSNYSANPISSAGRFYINNVEVKKLELNVPTINEYAFACCNSFTELHILNSVEQIEQYAFASCYNLVLLCLGTNLSSIGNLAFNYCHKLSVLDNDSLLDIEGRADYLFGNIKQYVKVYVYEGEELPIRYTANREFMLFNKYKTNHALWTLAAYLGDDTEIALPGLGAKDEDGDIINRYIIGEYFLSHNTQITKVTIDSYTADIISKFAFYYTSLTEIVYTGEKDGFNQLGKAEKWLYWNSPKIITVTCSNGDLNVISE